MKAIIIATSLTLAAPAMAKDTSRVPATGENVQVTELIWHCISERVTFKRDKAKRVTHVAYRHKGCRLVSVSASPAQYASWEQVATVALALVCEVLPFQMDECNG